MKFIKRLFLIVLVLMAGGFALLMLLPEEEEEKTGTTSVSGTTATYTAAEIPQDLIDSGVVREKQVKLKGDGTDTVTIMIYMNGSDLESDDSEATTDLTEMVKAGSSDNVNVVVQTMGTKSWNKKYGIASNRSQRYAVNGKGLTLLQDNLGQLDPTTSDTLTDFVRWSAATYPADRYILLFWDHGGGPVYGFGYDQWNDDEYACLSVDEMQLGLHDAGVYFDFIGMDCCIMSTLETCCALYDYCDYMILSEDFESGLGWSYTGWLKTLYKNSSTPTTELGKQICDDMVSANKSSSDGDDSILSVIDQSMIKVLYSSWMTFAYENEEFLLDNQSREVTQKRGGRVMPQMKRGFSDFLNYLLDEEDVTLATYYITDIMAVSQSASSESSAALSAALAQTLVYVACTDGDSDMTGIAVTLPYGDSSFYEEMAAVFQNIGMDNDYITWLKKFAGVSSSGYESYYEEDDYNWNGWDNYDDDYNWDNWEDDQDDDWEDLFSDWENWSFTDSFNYWFSDEDWEYDDEEDEYYYEGDEDNWFWDDWGYDDYHDDHHGGPGGPGRW